MLSRHNSPAVSAHISLHSFPLYINSITTLNPNVSILNLKVISFFLYVRFYAPIELMTVVLPSPVANEPVYLWNVAVTANLIFFFARVPTCLKHAAGTTFTIHIYLLPN